MSCSDALVVDLAGELEVLLGRVELARLELGEQLDRVGPAPLDLGDAPARLDLADRGAGRVLRRPRTSRRGSAGPVLGGTANAATVLQYP